VHLHTRREPHGVRLWWHVGTRATLHVEAYWWSPRCGLSFGPGDDGWDVSLRLPPLALYVSLDHMRLWRPMEKHIFTWDHNREVWLPDRREFDLSVSDWTIRLALWSRWGEWRSADPWWIRGVSLDLQRLVLGRRVYIPEFVREEKVEIPMPEGVYRGVATVNLVTRGFDRWRKRVAEEVNLDIPSGIPFAGKGENSWDCGDDGLFGIGGTSVADAIRRAQEAVTESRQRHGHASPEAVQKALSY
jgi:hypothetical protein